MNSLVWMRKLPASTGESLTRLNPKTLKDVLDNIILFERPSTDKVVDSEDIFNEYETYRKKLNIKTESYDACASWSLELFKCMFYLTKSLIINKSLTIRCPFTLNNITTADYFLTIIENPVLTAPDIICNYYFIPEDVIIGFTMGGGWNSDKIVPLYILSFTENKIINIINTNFHVHILDEKYYFRLRNYTRKFDKINTFTEPTVTALHGFASNLGHTLFNEWTGLFLLDYTTLISKIDNIIMGPYDPYLMSKYFERNNITTFRFKDWSSLNGKIGRGACISYRHSFISTRFSDFMLNHLRICRDENVSSEDSAITPEEIINKRKQVVTFVLRCGSRRPCNQVDVIVKVINKLIAIFPDIFVIFDGFSAPDDCSVRIGIEGNNATIIRDEYIGTVHEICKRIRTLEVKSLINEPIHNCVNWLRISKVCVYTAGSGCVNAGWLCKIPGIQFGLRHLNIYKEMDNVICENFPKISYLTKDITYENDNPVVNPDILVSEILKLNILRVSAD